MKKLFIILALTIAAVTNIYSQEYYYVDRKIAEHKSAYHEQAPTTMGIVTRFGYGFNVDAFNYGASLFYQWNQTWGITVGFDGYRIFNKIMEAYPGDPDPKNSNDYKMPLWDVRAGLMLTKYFMFGGMMGKWNVPGYYPNNIVMNHSQWIWNDGTTDFMYGAFATFMLPVSKWCGFNIDLAVTNKTGFNIGAGVNVTIPVK